MKITDQGIIISRRALEENSGVITIFSQNHGIVSGYIKNLAAKGRSDFYQIGNLVDFSWNARLSNHIGTLRCELVKSYFAVIMNDRSKLYSANSVFEILSLSLKPRQPHDKLYLDLLLYMGKLQSNPYSFLEYIKFELTLLTEIGYGLDLSKCSISGEVENLTYVSPKTGRSVTEAVGADYANKLLKLPSFIRDNCEPTSNLECANALHLTGYFLKRYVFRDGREPNYRSMVGHLSFCDA